MSWKKELFDFFEVTTIGVGGCLAIAFFAVLSWSLSFGFGYAFGLLVEWFAGKDVILGPLSLPVWTGIAFVALSFLNSGE